MSQILASGGQSTGVSASTSVLPMNIQDWFALGWTGWISLQSEELSRVFSNTKTASLAPLQSGSARGNLCCDIVPRDPEAGFHGLGFEMLLWPLKRCSVSFLEIKQSLMVRRKVSWISVLRRPINYPAMNCGLSANCPLSPGCHKGYGILGGGNE